MKIPFSLKKTLKSSRHKREFMIGRKKSKKNGQNFKKKIENLKA